MVCPITRLARASKLPVSVILVIVTMVILVLGSMTAMILVVSQMPPELQSKYFDLIVLGHLAAFSAIVATFVMARATVLDPKEKDEEEERR